MGLRESTLNTITSYEERVREIETLLLREVEKHLQKFKKEWEEAEDKLRKLLAKNGSLRYKDFDELMRGVGSWQIERENGIRNTVREFITEERTRIRELREYLTEKKRFDANDFECRMRQIQERQELRGKRLREIIETFDMETERIKSLLGQLLAKGESIKIRTLKKTVKLLDKEREKSITKEQDRIVNEMKDFLRHFNPREEQ